MLTKKLARDLSQEEAAFATLVANYDGYKRVLPPRATPTLTESGLLAVLFERQRYIAIHLGRRRACHEKMRAALWRPLASLLHSLRARTLVRHSAKPLIRAVPRHT
jgi:hypothetical protein